MTKCALCKAEIKKGILYGNVNKWTKYDLQTICLKCLKNMLADVED